MSAAMALVAGIIWDSIGPAFVFLAHVAIELLVRVPLLGTMSDTLEMTPTLVSVPVPATDTADVTRAADETRAG